MNPIQKLWLKALEPLSYVINEKMAKRSGKLFNTHIIAILEQIQIKILQENYFKIYLQNIVTTFSSIVFN